MSASSQRLIELTQTNNTKLALECLNSIKNYTDAQGLGLDVNYVGTVNLRAKKTEVVPHGEFRHEVVVEYEEFVSDVTPLFLASHHGNSLLVSKLLSLGANVNQKLYRGHATTAAVREGHMKTLEILIKGGASTEACEEALLEASYLGREGPIELLMGSQLIRPQVGVHALVSASCRGFINVVQTLIKCGVDPNAMDRVLLQSSKPNLHANVDCNALAAAVVSRQLSVVTFLLKVGVKTDITIRVGAWSWDTDTGEEFRVGAGLAEPYSAAWCAVEYFESSGAILRSLLQHLSPNATHLGRTLIHHAILCNNPRAAQVLLQCGADVEVPVKTMSSTKNNGSMLRPIHLSAWLGSDKVLEQLVASGCDIDSRTSSGDTALMICARHKHGECLKVLASGGADFGLVNPLNESVASIARSSKWARGFELVVLDVIRTGKKPKSSNASVFSPLKLSIEANHIEALRKLLEKADIDLDEQDDDGYSAAMIAVSGGHVEAFGLLIYAGANMMLQNKYGESAITLSKRGQQAEEFEKVILEHAISGAYNYLASIYALHRAAHRGDVDLVQKLAKKGYDVNAFDGDGYTPLMVAARGNHSKLCELLISYGAKCDLTNARQETALMLARKNNGFGNESERAILDELARRLVTQGARVKKHTKCGKGRPHYKELAMVAGVGVLRWGKSRKRNVVCREAEVGPSIKFRWNRRKKLDVEEPGVFHVVTTKNKQIHFVCEGGVEMSELWVRGIKLVTKDAIFGKTRKSPVNDTHT